MGLLSRDHNDDEEMDEWAYELTRPDSFPLAATIIGSIIILIISVGVNSIVGQRHILATALGGGLIAALLVWGVAWLITLRRARIGWMIGSFVTMLVVGLVVGLIGIGSAIGAMQEDLRAIADLKVNPIPGRNFPKAALAAPFPRAAFTYLKAVQDDTTKHRAALKALGYDAMRSAAALRANPGVLKHCDQRVTVTPMIEAYYARRRSAYARFTAEVGNANVDERFRKSLIDGMNKAQKQNGGLLQRAATNEHAQIGELIAMCQILARHHWVEQFGNIAFSSPADLREFRAHARREDDLASEERALMQESLSIMAYGRAQLRRGLF